MEEEKMLLDEAEAVHSELPEDIENLKHADLASEEWNKVFKKYLNYKEVKQYSPTDYYAINISANADKSRVKLGSNLQSNNSGYIQLEGKTGEEQSKVFHVLQATVNPEDVKITPNKDDASLFVEKDAKTIIGALKRISGLKASYALSKVDAKEAQSKLVQEQDLPKVIFDMYLDKASDGLKYWLGNGYDTLYRICHNLTYPLSSNEFLQIFINAHKDSNLRSYVNPTSQLVWLVNNAIADRLCSYKGLLAPKTFLNTLIFNNSLWVISFNQVKEIFDAYNTLIDLNVIPSYIKALPNYSQAILARNIILAGKEGDIVSFIENGGKAVTADNEEGSEETVKLVPYGKSPEDENILNTPVRPLSVIKKVLSDVEPDEEEGTRYITLQLINSDEKKVLAEASDIEVIKGEESDLQKKLKIKDQIIKDTKLQLIAKYHGSGSSILELSTWDSDEFDRVVSNRTNYFTPKHDIVANTEFIVDASWTGSRLSDVSLSTRSDDSVVAREDEPAETLEDAEVQPALNPAAAKNTLADLSKMSKQELVNNFSGNELKDIASQAASLLSKASVGAGIQQPIADTK